MVSINLQTINVDVLISTVFKSTTNGFISYNPFHRKQKCILDNLFNQSYDGPLAYHRILENRCILQHVKFISNVVLHGNLKTTNWTTTSTACTKSSNGLSWRVHHMETISELLARCKGYPPFISSYSLIGQMIRSSVIHLSLVWADCWKYTTKQQQNKTKQK